MADTRERLPDFPRQDYDPISQRSLVEIVERRLRAIDTGVLQLDRTFQLLGQGESFAPVVHPHVEADISDLQAYLLNISNESIFDLNDVSKGAGVNGYVLKYNSTTEIMSLQPDNTGGGGGTGDIYVGFRDTSGNQTSLAGDEYLRFVSANTLLDTLVIDNDATYGDMVRLTVRNDLIDHDVLTNYVADQHVLHASVVLTAGVGLDGGGDITVSRTFDLADTAVTPTNYGDASNVATFTVDQQGRLTVATDVLISITESQISDFGNYGELDVAETISGTWTSSSPFLFGQQIDGTSTPILTAYSEGMFAALGDAQTMIATQRVSTPNATPTAMTTNGSAPGATNMLTLPDDCSWTLTAYISARDTSNQDTGSWVLQGMLDKATTAGSIVASTFVKTTLAKDDGTWDVAMTTNTTYGSPQIDVTGAAGKTIRWMARVEITQVRH